MRMNQRMDDRQKAAAVDCICRAFGRLPSEIACAEYRVIAEPIRARERAEVETNLVLDLLRYAAASLYSSNNLRRIRMGLLGDVSRTVRVVPQLTDGGDRFCINSEAVGSLIPFEIDDDVLAHLDRIGVMRLSQMLQRRASELTEFERAVLYSIHWFSNAQVQTSAEGRLLDLMICLESLLTPEDREPIGSAIAEGTALLIANELDSRKAVKRTIKQLYGKRSSVSHGGETVVHEREVRQLELIAGTLLAKMIERAKDFRTRRELLQWIEDEKLR